MMALISYGIDQQRRICDTGIDDSDDLFKSWIFFIGNRRITRVARVPI